MGCDCKAVSHITRIKRKYGYEPPTSKNVKIGEKIKMILSNLLLWVILLPIVPVFFIIMIFGKLFKKNITFFKKIKIRL
jgi:hypothetical protein